jgi:hypothetical protein
MSVVKDTDGFHTSKEILYCFPGLHEKADRFHTAYFFAAQNPTKVFHACLLKGTYDVYPEKNLLF